MALCVESHTFDWRPDYPLVVSAKRYWDPSSAAQDGITFVLAHGTGFHGEQWEPMLNHVFSLSKGPRAGALPIREAWSVECPNHGEAAVINESVLRRSGYNLVFSWAEYTHVLFLFLKHNKKVQFEDRKLIGIGHSMGAVSLCLTQTYPQPPRFTQLVLCEPMVAPTDIPNGDPMVAVSNTLISATEVRRDVWPSLENASSTLKARKAFAVWDDDVFRLYLIVRSYHSAKIWFQPTPPRVKKHGFRELPTETYPDQKGVTLKCPKVQEAACYRDSHSSRRLFDFLPALCARLPVHVIWGAKDDAMVPEVKARVTNAKSGRRMASITRVEGAGHLIVQMAPKGLAVAVFNAVASQNTAPPSPQSRL